MIGDQLVKLGGEFTYTDVVPFKNQLIWAFGSVAWGARYKRLLLTSNA